MALLKSARKIAPNDAFVAQQLALPDDDKIVNADNYKYYVELFQYRDLNVDLRALADSAPDLSHVGPED